MWHFFFYLYKYACILITAVSIWSINLQNTLLYNKKLSTPFYKQRTEAQTARFMVMQMVWPKTGNCMPSSQVLSQHCFSSSSFVTAVVKKVFLLSNSFLCLSTPLEGFLSSLSFHTVALSCIFTLQILKKICMLY